MRQGPRVDEQRLPIACRWSLRALGSVEPGSSPSPRDPVSAWLLKQRPALAPQFAAPSILTMVRVRSVWFDERIAEFLSGPGTVVTVGSGLDSRWSRLPHAAERFVEVEEPSLIEFKSSLFEGSMFSEVWKRVRSISAAEADWPGAPVDGPVIVALEGVSTRLGGRGLRVLLGRLRRSYPDAALLVDVPGFLTSTTGSSVGGAQWEPFGSQGAAHLSHAEIRALGLEIHEDQTLVGRPDLRLAFNGTRCPGMEPLRLLSLRPARLEA